MASSWEEIRRLAADFQRVQLVESSYKLSERNCIEIISKLIDMGLLNVMHTIDGKEYITEKQIEREIYDELYVHGGRINVVELQILLNIDIAHIESKANEIVKNDPNLYLVLGQIISKDYMNKISDDINELMQGKGNVAITELTNLYELPADFIHQIVEPRVGTIIKGNYDGKIIYTHDYVNRQKARLAGALEACIKPIRLVQITKEHGIDSGMIFDIFDELISTGQIDGTLFGGRQEQSAVFVPAFYSRAQQQYVESFFKQNGHIDFASLKKIGITNEPESYIRSLPFAANQELKFMSSSCFTSFFVDQLEQEVEDHLNRVGYCDLVHQLPSSLNEKDSHAMTLLVKGKLKQTHDCELMNETYLVKKEFLKSLSAKFQAKMEAKAQEDLKRPNFVLAIRTEHAVVSLGGGSTTTKQQPKSAQKGGKKQQVVDSTDETFVEITFMDRAVMQKELKSSVKDLPDELIDHLVDSHFLKSMNHQYFDLLKNKIEMGLIATASSSSDADNKMSSSSSSLSPSKKNATIKETQEKIKTFLLNVKIFEKALKAFNDPKVQELLSKHLLKTICTDITNDMLKFLATEQMITFNEENFSNEARSKIIQKFKDPQHKQRFTELNQALANKTSGEVIELVEKAAETAFELSTTAAAKKAANDAAAKREKEALLQLRESTKSTLEHEKDPATILHLTSILLYYYATGHLLNAPGRCVPNILEAIRPHMEGMEDTFNKLVAFQNLVIESISKVKTDPTIQQLINEDRYQEIRAIGLDASKNISKSSK